jgi:hypothetical protein
VKWYGQNGRKASWIVKWYGKYGRNYINRQNQSTTGKLWKP